MDDESKKYPNIENFDYEKTITESTCELIREILAENAMNVVNNTILGNYITIDIIKINIHTYAQKIKLSKNTYIGEIILGFTELFLTPHFFTKTINRQLLFISIQ